MANNKLVNGDVLQALITELEKRSIGSLESTGSAITIKDLAGNTKDTLDVSIPSFTGATDSENGTSGLVPIPTAGKQDFALCGDATFKVLPISGGGTGATTATQALKNLGGVKSVNGVVAGANGDVHIDLTAKPQKLSLNTDLNTLTESGLFYADNEYGENLVVTLKNRPSQELIRGGGTALIEVVKSNNQMVRQVYTEHLIISPNICVRTLAAGAWSEWVRVNTILKVW